MILKEDRNQRRKIRHARIRKKVFGTAERPRLSVFRSLKHIYAQLIDDERGHTLTAASTLDLEIRDQLKGLTKIEQSRLVGQLLARRAKAKGIERVVFDRGGYKYHGRVRALAEGARGEGLEF
ncbi:MAG: 50S ribosomal protein L18 [Armatimonadota bacterium]|nr:50S ribosomal protein L18 [Armatimonadota bacterium]MDR7438605.1 50S ribosomal protein L18 [Armatimonadota bacterium]MDR7562674.1 50S ribosomal protein L18 [Armatimonadota bacterium]MDR7567549.1 50S ribosomal protein L18 [Armatimonadota bacterium]MDR7601763.1 50S ribosomal protein L18 [Armatimonadota bacterium]